MAAYFLDSSVLVKRYIAETGSIGLLTIVDPVTGNELHVVRIAEVEVVAAMARRRRGGSISVGDATTMLADFDMDLTNQYRIVEVTAALLKSAKNLADTHASRGCDTVQLAAAPAVNIEVLAAGLPALTMVSADNELNAAAQTEGLIAEDPNARP